MKFQQVQTKKKYEEVCEILHNKIRSNELKPGDRIDSVEHLAEQLQVSRSAVREAMSALKAMGLIEIKQGSGTFVKEFSEHRSLISRSLPLSYQTDKPCPIYSNYEKLSKWVLLQVLQKSERKKISNS